jgi:NADPH-dependent ferric siderophore reductase
MTTNSGPDIRRVRHEIKRRQLQVQRVERLTPKMVRVVLGGEDLQGFTSLGFDDHVKVMLPEPGGEPPVLRGDAEHGAAEPKPMMRDYTPRRYDASKGELLIDFVIHDAGPATSWAASAQPGQTLGIGGPRGSFVIPADLDCHLLIGDETALPAIGRRLEELPADVRAIVVAEIDNPEEALKLETAAHLDIVWVDRKGAPAGDAEHLLKALRDVKLPTTGCYAWVAAESLVARAVRKHLLEERGFDKHWIKAAGYWRRGVIGAHDRIED